MFLHWKCYSSFEKLQISKITFERCVGFHAEFSKVHTVFLEVNGNFALIMCEGLIGVLESQTIQTIHCPKGECAQYLTENIF